MAQIAYLQRWNALHDTIARMHAAGSVEGAIEVVRETARHVTGADGICVIRRIGDEVAYIAEDAISPLWTGQQFPIERCVSGLAILHNRPIVIPDVEHDARVPLNLYLPTFVRSMAMFPVGTPVPSAAIGAYWRSRHDIDGRSIMLLSAVARALGTVLDILPATTSAAPELRRAS
jgi:GAF domain-containing protein